MFETSRVWCADGAVLPTEEMSLARDMAVTIDCGTNLADLLSNALPPDKRAHDKDKPLSDSSVSLNFIFQHFSSFHNRTNLHLEKLEKQS